MASAFRRVLCATDLSELGNGAIPAAFAAAGADATVTLVFVVHAPPVPSPLVPHYGKAHASAAQLAERQREAAAKLAALGKKAARGLDVRVETSTPLAAAVAPALLAEAERLDADLICLATHARTGLSKLVLGSAAHEVLHQAGRPVLLVPAPLGD